MPKKGRTKKGKTNKGKTSNVEPKKAVSGGKQAAASQEAGQLGFAHYLAAITTKIIEGGELHLQDVDKLERAFEIIKNDPSEIKKELQFFTDYMVFDKSAMELFFERSITLLRITAEDGVSENISANADQDRKFCAVNVFAEIIWLLLHVESRRKDLVSRSGVAKLGARPTDNPQRARQALSGAKIAIILKLVDIFRVIISQDGILLNQPYNKFTSLYGMSLDVRSPTLKHFILVYLTNISLSGLSIFKQKSFADVRHAMGCLRSCASRVFDREIKVDYRIVSGSRSHDLKQVSFFCHADIPGMSTADLYYFPSTKTNFAATLRIESLHNSKQLKCAGSIYFNFHAPVALKDAFLCDKTYKVEHNFSFKGEGCNAGFNEKGLEFVVLNADLVVLLEAENYIDAIDICKSSFIIEIYKWIIKLGCDLNKCVAQFSRLADMMKAAGYAVVAKTDYDQLITTSTALFAEARKIQEENASLRFGLMEKNQELLSRGVR